MSSTHGRCTHFQPCSSSTSRTPNSPNRAPEPPTCMRMHTWENVHRVNIGSYVDPIIIIIIVYSGKFGEYKNL